SDGHAHRVDAVTQLATGVERQIGGRKPKLAPARIAAPHDSRDEPRIAEQLSRIGNVAGRERPAHPARPEAARRPPSDPHPPLRNDFNRKAVTRALRAEKFGRSLTPPAEVKIKPDHGA